jgi:hypothetical protein
LRRRRHDGELRRADRAAGDRGPLFSTRCVRLRSTDDMFLVCDGSDLVASCIVALDGNVNTWLRFTCCICRVRLEQLIRVTCHARVSRYVFGSSVQSYVMT